MKKLISLFTALFLLMSALPAQAGSPEISDLLTEYYKEWQELPFGLTEDELTCVDGVLYGRDILLLYPKTRTDACFVIPDGIGYVWDFAFVGNDLLEKVVVPDSCKILGAFAFWECANLAEVEFGANSELLIVDDFCFSECYALPPKRTRAAFCAFLCESGDMKSLHSSIALLKPALILAKNWYNSTKSRGIILRRKGASRC